MNEKNYPPQPWDLHGHAYIGAWLVPVADLPAPHSPATRPVTIFGRGFVGAMFFIYEQPSPLTYNEIMSTVIVRQGWRIRVSVTHIWVDSEASRDGGRELWGIPKQLAEFDVVPHTSYTAHGIGAMTIGRVRRLPWMLPGGFRMAQDQRGSLLVTPVKGRMRLGTASAQWTFDADGPLAFLHGRRPFLSLAAAPFRLLFGTRRPRQRRQLADRQTSLGRSAVRSWDR